MVNGENRRDHSSLPARSNYGLPRDDATSVRDRHDIAASKVFQ
jgi:hypothetical protein